MSAPRPRQIPYAQIDRDYNIDAMTDAALGVGRAGTPLEQVGEQLHTLVSGVSVPVAVTWNSQKLAAAVAAIAVGGDKDPVDATISRPGRRISVSPAANGQQVDGQQLLAASTAALSDPSATEFRASRLSQP